MYTRKHTYEHGKLHFTGSVRAGNSTDMPDFYQPKQHVLQATHFSIISTFQVKRRDNLTVRYILLIKDFGRALLLNLLFRIPYY
jgi:hypothetical protein